MFLQLWMTAAIVFSKAEHDSFQLVYLCITFFYRAFASLWPSVAFASVALVSFNKQHLDACIVFSLKAVKIMHWLSALIDTFCTYML